MKKQVIFLFVLISIASCKQKESETASKEEQNQEQEIPQNESLTIPLKFIGKINGYEVSGVFKPTKFDNEFNGVQGPAILTFKKDNEKFTIIHRLYSIGSVDSKTGKKYDLMNLKEIVDSFYTENNEQFQEQITSSRNFFFSDANFDGKKDIVLIEIRGGNKTQFDYKFVLNNRSSFDDISTANNELVESPLDMITEVAVFDRANKTIKVPNDAEDFSSGSKTYSVIQNEEFELPKFKLIKQEKGE